jgi:hypothetical protein
MTVLRQPAVAITFGRSREALEPFFLMLKSAPWSHATWFASFTSAGAAGKSVAQIGAGKASSRSEWTSPLPTEIKSLIKTVEGRWRPHFFDSHIHWTSRKLSHRYPMNIVSKIAVTDGPSTLSSTPGSPPYAIGLRTLPRPLHGQDRPRRNQCASLARRVSEIIETQTGKPLSRTSRQATINQSLPSDLGIRWLESNQIIGCPAGVLKSLEQTFLEWAGTSRRRANSPRLVRLHRPCDHILRDPAERFIERRNGLIRCDRRKFLAFLE